MASKLPVINTKLMSAVPEVSINGLTGITVEPKNSEKLKTAIEKIINNKELYETYSNNCSERVIEFSREKMTDSYLKLYSN
jgi:rhamnosyl/mannosyltransferase